MTIKNMNTVITLGYPVEYGGDTVEKLTMRRPITNDEIRKSQRLQSGLTDQAVQAQMFADMCGVDYELVILTDLDDQQQMVDTYEAFMPERVAAAKKSQAQQA